MGDKVRKKELLLRAGAAEPWRYGPYRVVITRRVTEEEQISVECYEETLPDAQRTYAAIMDSMRQAMIAHNEKVVLAHSAHLSRMDRMIERRAEKVRELDAACAERREWLTEKGMHADDMPAPFEDGEDA